ncbi:MAG: hypothetical protein HY928_06470 [Elusimicrobia bacterium]|nr:hypothetical protein [Elusimicrobiota bacterium]
MRNFLAAVLLAALALPAEADVVDSGSLVIGQQGIIGGTMTVQGNAFSVGGSTFSVSYGTVSVGGLLKPSSAGIQWADGSVSTTASAGGSGSASLAATQTFTGGNTFAGTVSASTAIYSQNPWLGLPNVQPDTTTVGGYASIWSVDGAFQSSGCVVAVYWDSSRGRLVETSTTTDFVSFNGVMSGVLYEGCQPSSYCKVITKGLVRIKAIGAAIAGQAVSTYTTRCWSSNNAETSTACTYNMCAGKYMTAPDGNNFVWAMLTGP